VAEFGLAGLDAINFGPGAPAQAHRRDESIEVAALVRSHRVLEAFAA
jgi:succinyl-diaminopimelate desuccinylase